MTPTRSPRKPTDVERVQELRRGARTARYSPNERRRQNTRQAVIARALREA